MKLTTATFLIFGFVITVVVGYAGMIIWLTWPINVFSVDRSGVFGDSFGAVNALFSGLAFGGLIITVLLQRAELKESREIFKTQRFEASLYRLLD